MEDDDQIVDEATLQNPDQLSPQGRTDGLVKSVEEDDLLAVLLMVDAMDENEINSTSSEGGLRPLEAAIVVPSARTDARKLIVEVLLLSGAEPSSALSFAQQSGNEAMQELLRGWNEGGREQATTAAQLLDMDFDSVERWIQSNLYGDPTKIKDELLDSPPGPSPSTPSDSRDPTVAQDDPVAPACAEHKSLQPTSAPPTPPRFAPPSTLSPPPASPSKPLPPSPPPDEKIESAPPSHGQGLSEVTAVESEPRSTPSRRRRSSRSRSPRRWISKRQARPRSLSPACPSKTRHALPPPPSAWIHVHNIPISVGPRYLYEVLRDKGISVEDIYLEQNLKSTSRFAFVGVRNERAASDAVKVLDKRQVEGVFLQASPFRHPTSGARAPDLHAHQPRCRYLGPPRNAELPPHPPTAHLVFSHVSKSTTPRVLHHFLEDRIGRGCIRDMQLLSFSNKGEQAAIVELNRQTDRLFAITDLDGVLLDRQAITVNWYPKRSKPRRGSSPGRRRSSTGQGDRGPRMSDADGLVASPSSHQATPEPAATTLPSDAATSPAVSPADASALTCLQGLDLPQHTLNTIQRLWQPHNVDDSDSSASFSRSAKFDVDFGFLSKREAKLALDANEESPAYPDDETMQQRYEAFLKAQAGESMDWYTVFFTKLAEFSTSAAAFAEQGRLAADSVPPPPPRPPHDP